MSQVAKVIFAGDLAKLIAAMQNAAYTLQEDFALPGWKLQLKACVDKVDGAAEKDKERKLFLETVPLRLRTVAGNVRRSTVAGYLTDLQRRITHPPTALELSMDGWDKPNLDFVSSPLLRAALHQMCRLGAKQLDQLQVNDLKLIPELVSCFALLSTQSCLNPVIVSYQICSPVVRTCLEALINSSHSGLCSKEWTSSSLHAHLESMEQDNVGSHGYHDPEPPTPTTRCLIGLFDGHMHDQVQELISLFSLLSPWAAAALRVMVTVVPFIQQDEEAWGLVEQKGLLGVLTHRHLLQSSTFVNDSDQRHCVVALFRRIQEQSDDLLLGCDLSIASCPHRRSFPELFDLLPPAKAQELIDQCYENNGRASRAAAALRVMVTVVPFIQQDEEAWGLVEQKGLLGVLTHRHLRQSSTFVNDSVQRYCVVALFRRIQEESDDLLLGCDLSIASCPHRRSFPELFGLLPPAKAQELIDQCYQSDKRLAAGVLYMFGRVLTAIQSAEDQTEWANFQEHGVLQSLRVEHLYADPLFCGKGAPGDLIRFAVRRVLGPLIRESNALVQDALVQMSLLCRVLCTEPSVAKAVFGTIKSYTIR
jgi:hypothetical protein